MTKQVTREQLNQLLEREVDRYIQEEYLLEQNIKSKLKKLDPKKLNSCRN